MMKIFKRVMLVWIGWMAFSGWLALPGWLGDACHAQENSFFSPEDIESGVLLNLAKARAKDAYRPEQAKIGLDLASHFLESKRTYLQMRMDLSKKLIEEALVAIQKGEVELEAVLADSVGTSGQAVGSMETIELLMRNCLVESQRIDWEIAVEQANAEQDLSARVREVVAARLEAEEVRVEGLKSQLASAEKALARLEDMRAGGVVSISEVESKRMEMERFHADLRAALAQLRANKQENVLELETATESSARKVKLLGTRAKAIASQMESLQKQQKLARKAEQIRADIRRRTALIDRMETQLMDQQSKLLEAEAFLNMIRSVEWPESESKNGQPGQ